MMYGVGLILVAMAGGLEWLIIVSKHTLSASLLGVLQKSVRVFLQGLLSHYIEEELGQSCSWAGRIRCNPERTSVGVSPYALLTR
jgi:hypothetical protein